MGGYDFGDPGKDDDDKAYRDALGRVSKDTYNAVNQITPTNPFGRQGFFSRVFGIDPKNIDYTSTYDVSSNNPFIAAGGKYGLFANPMNRPGLEGFRADIPTAEGGAVRQGLQSGIFSNAGQETALGTLADYDTDFSALDRLAMAASPMGFLGQILGGTKTGLVQGTDPVSLMAGTPVGALMPTDEMAARGQTSGGIGRQLSEGLGQFTSSLSDAMKTAKSLISDTKAKNATAPQQAQPNNLDLRGFESRFAPQAPSSFEGIMAPSSLEAVLADVQPAQAPQPSFGIAGNIQDYMPVQGVAEQDVRSPRPLSTRRDPEGTLYSPTDMYGMATGQLAPPATPFNIQSIGPQRDRKISANNFLDAYSKKMGI